MRLSARSSGSTSPRFSFQIRMSEASSRLMMIRGADDKAEISGYCSPARCVWVRNHDFLAADIRGFLWQTEVRAYFQQLAKRVHIAAIIL